MSFLVYLFVLLVAAGSVIFGLDWTQAPLNPPPYATPPAQTATVKSAPIVKEPAATAPRDEASPTALAGNAVTTRDDAHEAQARATDQADNTTTTAAAAPHCNIAACSASYRSFRESDCTYQPYNGPRRLCTRTSAASSAATATHARNAGRRNEPRVSDSRDYGDDHGIWSFDFFGGGNYDR
jgi:hypothetical protein